MSRSESESSSGENFVDPLSKSEERKAPLGGLCGLGGLCELCLRSALTTVSCFKFTEVRTNPGIEDFRPGTSGERERCLWPFEAMILAHLLRGWWKKKWLCGSRSRGNWELVGQDDNVICGSGRLVVWRGLTVAWLGPLACKVSVLLRVDQA